MTNKVYHTDGIHEFIAIHGFTQAVKIIAKVLELSEKDAERRLEYAQKNSIDEV